MKAARASWSSFADLSILETVFYSLTSFVYLSYISYRTLLVSPRVFQTVTQSFLTNGTEWSFRVSAKGLWRHFGQAQDSRDLEWTIFRFLLKEHTYLYITHLIGSRLLKTLGWSSKARLLVLAVIALIGTCRVVGVSPVVRSDFCRSGCLRSSFACQFIFVCVCVCVCAFLFA